MKAVYLSTGTCARWLSLGDSDQETATLSGRILLLYRKLHITPGSHTAMTA
jgi:hypothetical protein